jgi:hypothetical protein
VSPSKRLLRPRKVDNYQALLEGDETTLKSIREEELEAKRLQGTSSVTAAVGDPAILKTTPLVGSKRLTKVGGFPTKRVILEDEEDGD